MGFNYKGGKTRLVYPVSAYSSWAVSIIWKKK